MATFLETANRVTSELARTNLLEQAKAAINDAVAEAAKTRFYFNEMINFSVPVTAGQEYVSDLGLVEIDAIYYNIGTSRYYLFVENDRTADLRADGNPNSGQLQSYSRYEQKLRLDPIPSVATTLYVKGYGKMQPAPFVADADTNVWLTIGERYIRALAKSILLKDVVRDFREATVYEAIAMDEKDRLEVETEKRFSTDTLKGNMW